MPYVLRCFPHDDTVFAIHAAAGLGRLDGNQAAEADGIGEALQDWLRASYPAVTVHCSHELAELSPTQRILYVYRDLRPLTK